MLLKYLIFSFLSALSVNSEMYNQELESTCDIYKNDEDGCLSQYYCGWCNITDTNNTNQKACKYFDIYFDLCKHKDLIETENCTFSNNLDNICRTYSIIFSVVMASILFCNSTLISISVVNKNHKTKKHIFHAQLFMMLCIILPSLLIWVIDTNLFNIYLIFLSLISISTFFVFYKSQKRKKNYILINILY